jgi:hypothetical protein
MSCRRRRQCFRFVSRARIADAFLDAVAMFHDEFGLTRLAQAQQSSIAVQLFVPRHLTIPSRSIP